MAQYKLTETVCWTGRTDGAEPDLLRWHQVMNLCEAGDLPKLSKGIQGVAFIGFCSDEGVRRNYGRVGAAQSPDTLRKACSNFPVIANHIVLADAGNVVCDDENLEAAQFLLSHKIQEILNQGYLPIVLGGSHDTSLGCFMAISPLTSGQELGVINFDAHFDLRQPETSVGATSGSWAFQIAEQCREQKNPFHYLVLGVQQYSNTRRLFEYAEEIGAAYFKAEDFTNDQLHQMLNRINGILSQCNKLILTIDMDVFASPFAPGVSAPSFNGIAPNAMFKRMLRHIVLSGKVSTIDICEVNPLFDVDNRTSRLAAAFIFDMVQAADINAEYPG